MKIGSLCRRRVVTIDTAASLNEAAVMMREHHVGALVVTTPSADGLQVAGIVTDRDLVIDVLARSLDVNQVTIGELAHQPLVVVSEDDDASQAIAVMQGSGVRRVVVSNSEQRLTGIVSLDDLLLACASDLSGLAGVIRSGIERESADASAGAPLSPPVLRVPAMGTRGWGAATV